MANIFSDVVSVVQTIFNSKKYSPISPSDKREVIARLKFIAEIKPKQKIDPVSLGVDGNTLWTSIKRSLVGSSRESTYDFFSSTLERSKDIIKGALLDNSEGDQIFVYNMVKDLINAMDGLRHTQDTYSTDRYTVVRIQVLLEEVSAYVVHLVKTYPNVFPDIDISRFTQGKKREKIVEVAIPFGSVSPSSGKDEDD
jgi:hypothetical protein